MSEEPYFLPRAFEYVRANSSMLLKYKKVIKFTKYNMKSSHISLSIIMQIYNGATVTV